MSYLVEYVGEGVTCDWCQIDGRKHQPATYLVTEPHPDLDNSKSWEFCEKHFTEFWDE